MRASGQPFGRVRGTLTDAPKQPLRRADGNSRRASFKTWLRKHMPLVYAGLYDDPLLERRRRAELARIARERRAALAYCIECRNPLLATEYGFQFCPYERAGQHAKVKAILYLSHDSARVWCESSAEQSFRLRSAPVTQF